MSVSRSEKKERIKRALRHSFGLAAAVTTAGPEIAGIFAKSKILEWQSKKNPDNEELKNKIADFEITAEERSEKAFARATLTFAKFSGSRQSYLGHAVELGDLKTTERLLKNGADPNYQGTENVFFEDREKMTPVILVASRSAMIRDEKLRTRMVSLLLDHGANPDLQEDVTSRTALWWAVQNGNKECVLELIKRGANPEIKAMYSGPRYAIQTPLELAIETQKTDIAAIITNREQIFEAEERRKRDAREKHMAIQHKSQIEKLDRILPKSRKPRSE